MRGVGTFHVVCVEPDGSLKMISEMDWTNNETKTVTDPQSENPQVTNEAEAVY